ncbi:MAG: glycosyltransferase family 4 protein [Verrucomicrobiota bacterium]
MRVATVHYHLKPGGVTRVMENAFAALQGRDVEMVALTSEPYTGDAALPHTVVPGLAYTQPNEKPDPGALWFNMRKAARDALEGEPDIWHIHNHCLGKNTAIPQVIDRIAAEKPVLLQVHDFAEDGRPSNYASMEKLIPNLKKLYPQGSQVHYGLLNSRDLSYLTDCGFASQSLHLLPNPVSLNKLNVEKQPLPEFSDKRLLLYPTRAIRRKNLGEILLWAAIADEDTVLATTLSPSNPTAKPIHNRWREFAKGIGLPVRFALGEETDISFPAMMAGADAIITTSVAEGFGLAFLEPYLFDQPLVGRNIPDITSDFSKAGVELNNLYDRMLVPTSWLGEDTVRATLEQGLRAYYAAYNRDMPGHAVEIAFASMTAGERIEFGRLSEPLQEKVITRLNNDSSAREAIKPNVLERPSQATIIANRELIAEAFSLEQYGENLFNIYQKVAASEIEPLSYASREQVLDQFLDPRRFNLLRT